jgi:sporulation protein YlmC with PRC-barrel domain
MALLPTEGMAAMTEFTLGARASCTDGYCGLVRRTVIDPAAGTITHLVIEPGHHHGPSGRLVPVGLVEQDGGELRLTCTLDEFTRLDPAEEVDVAGSDYAGGYGQAEAVQGYGNVGSMGVGGSVSGMGIGSSLGHRTPVLITHSVPLGETEVAQHDRVHATDGEIGQVHGFVMNPESHKVTHIVLSEGHLWGRKQVVIPVSAVTAADGGIRLNLTKKQVEELPPPGQAG